VNYKRKSRRRFFFLMRSRTPPISSKFRGGGGWNTPNPPLGTPLYCTLSAAFQVDIWQGFPDFKYLYYHLTYVDRDSSVGIATRYGLEGSGIEFQWGARFSAPVQTLPGGHPASYTMGTGSFPGVKRPGRDVDHPPHLAPRLKKE